MREAAEGDWLLFDVSGSDTWPEQWEPIPYRADGDGRFTFRLQPPPHSGNRLGGIHGAFLAGIAEWCMGLPFYHRSAQAGIVTISLAFDYPAGGVITLPIEGKIELVRETGRMMFVAVSIRQGDALLLHGHGTLRKLT